MRAINTKFATLSSTTSTVASFGMLGCLMGCVSITLSDMFAPCKESLNFLDQLINIKWFLNVPVTPGFECLLTIATHHIRGQCKDGNLCKSRHVLDLCRQRIPIHV